MESKKRSSGIDFKSILSRANMPLVTLCILVIYAIVAILVSYLKLDVSIVPCCIMILLEVLLAVLLSRIPLWVHGLVFIAEIVAGIIASQIPFMVLMAFVYVGAITFLYIWERNE
ncbi:MAG: hypothetical protein K5773_01340 [Pseudobutyrivibrio sp.]|nr:hypothetical protein [Pseudobutyrivibrio sp.]